MSVSEKWGRLRLRKNGDGRRELRIENFELAIIFSLESL